MAGRMRRYSAQEPLPLPLPPLPLTGMSASRDSMLRRIAGVSAGASLGCSGAVALLVLLADGITRADHDPAAWDLGVDLLRVGFGPAVLVGGLLGSWLGRRHLARPLRRAWTRRPPGTFLNHYPVALLGGAIVGAASSVFTIPAAVAVVDTLDLFAEMLVPKIVSTTWILMAAAVFLGVLSVARWTVHSLDRDIHVRRRLRNGLRPARG